MPYITQDSRKNFEPLVNKMYIEMSNNSVTPGDLNYLMTSLASAYIESKGMSYTHLNDVIGVLDACSKEFYRRVVAPYEDEKISQNGDVY